MSAPDPTNPSELRQSAAAVMMVRPCTFDFNPQTSESNRFQARPDSRKGDAHTQAQAEFDGLAAALQSAGVAVHAFTDRVEPLCPDAVFPNNWVSLHADGTVVLYPMLAPNRRLERRLDLLVELEQRGGYRVERLVDLTHHERQGRFLEGTGSVVFDHRARVAYACRSPRTDAEVFQELCDELGYEAFECAAVDAEGVPVYHTNVVLSVGTRFAVVCAEAIASASRDRLLERLAASGRHVEAIGRSQMAQFAANLLELRAATGGSLLAVSRRGWDSLAVDARERLSRCVDRVVDVPVPTIEHCGGGSVRCMLAEVFLPPAGGGASR
jgi:hypothetical protein